MPGLCFVGSASASGLEFVVLMLAGAAVDWVLTRWSRYSSLAIQLSSVLFYFSEVFDFVISIQVISRYSSVINAIYSMLVIFPKMSTYSPYFP